MKNDTGTKRFAYVTLNLFRRTLIVIVCLIYCLLAFATISAQVTSVSLSKQAQDSITFVGLLNALKHQPKNFNTLLQAGKLAGTLGGRAPSGKNKNCLIAHAKSFSKAAIDLNPNNVDAHFSMIIALGLASENASSAKERLQNAKTIKSEVDLILTLDPNHAGAYFVLGKWHQGLSNLSAVEKIFCNTFLGGLPDGASPEDALQNFQRAVTLQPNFILFHYGLAQAMSLQGDRSGAVQVLEHALSLPILEVDDVIRKNNCFQLLKKIKPTAI